MSKWRTKTLGDLLEYEQPTKYIVKSTDYTESGTPVLTANKGFILGYTEETAGLCLASEEEPVVIFDDFTCDNKYVDFNFKIKSSAIKILRPKNGNNLLFMHSAMQQIISEIGEHKRHWISEYQNNTIDIPNVFEQEAIASKIMEWQERISGLEAEIERMGELKKGLMQQIFSGKLRFKNEDGNDFPAWESKKLGDVTGDFDNQRKPVKGLDRVKGQYPYYGANGVVDYVKDYIFDGEYVLLAEDGVVDISNYPVHYVNGKFWANNHAHILKGHENILDNSYLYYALQNIGFHKYITGSAQTKLNGKVLKTIYVPIPCVTEQQKIATFLSDLNFQITALKSLCDETAKQKKWLLNNLVTGKIRLPRFDDKSEESKKNTEEVGNE